ncbi:flap endonuclease GEN-like 1 isoform X2 [Ricinus communis]|uniref:flap endonuclease GEN-like 1 isoform X2 n=1 Tax=Ricinus communis TaxID=3988 RepID=UPI0007727179|nr:flap endonuclease GEN-like 1 isoform X2 [Ricinus communis]|eukprot:XP_015582634.1 flap endonuclease GEN-like 1 isoform X2 [Ricinus communis]
MCKRELLELFGMPVLKANGEAEALCAQLNSQGLVDACITADSDAFLFGAKCVIKSIKPNSKEPFECYQMSDIESGLALKRKHLIAIALLVGNDHDLNGVQGIGVDTALRFVQTFHEDEILNCLREIGKGNTNIFLGVSRVVEDLMIDPHENSLKSKISHCSFCGHPGSKRAHFKSSCEYCGNSNGEGCTKKSGAFRCNCGSCNKDRKAKEEQKRENWQIKVCDKMFMEPNFPNDDIIEMYLCNNHAEFTEDDDTCLSWGSPNTDMLVDFLAFHKLWHPSYIRQRILPVLSTIYLRDMAAKPEKALLYGQYEFDSIQRIKVRYGHESYVIKWKKAANTISSNICINIVEELDKHQEDIVKTDESIDQLEEYNVPKSYVDDGCWFLLTDENMDLVQNAFPDAVDKFLKEKEQKESKRRLSSSTEKSESVKSKGVQLNITEFYRSTKVQFAASGGEEQADCSENQDDVISTEKRKISSSNLPKSVRRRLLFK